MLTHKEVLPGLLLLSAAALSLWFIMEINHEESTQPNNGRHPEVIAENIYATRMDSTGQIKDQFYSPIMKHFSEKKITEFQQPHIIAYGADKKTSPWKITAEYGRAYDGIKKIDFFGHVKADQDFTHITSDTLIVQTIDGRANEITALGSNKHPATYQTTTSPGKPEVISHADTIKFFPQQHKILFIGNAEVKQQGDSYSGPQMEYDTLQKIVITPHIQATRHTFILEPRS